jgi:hypothetical protein
MKADLAEPWQAFLADLDARVSHQVALHRCGGFVVTTRYGMPRTTADLDVLSILPGDDQRKPMEMAGRGSALHKTHGVYVDLVMHQDATLRKLEVIGPKLAVTSHSVRF